MMGTLVFAYGSLVSRASAARTLGEPLEVVGTARLRGWRRRWSTARDNLRSEKCFEPVDGGEPFRYCLGLGIEPDPGAEGPNGALLRLTDAQLERLDLREIRYRRVDVTAMVAAAGRSVAGILDSAPASDRAEARCIIAYVAKPRHHRPEPPPGSVILASYLRAVQSAFASLGAGELELFRATTGPPPVDVVEGVLAGGQIPVGNPRTW